MIRRYLLPALALTGVVVVAIVIVAQNRPLTPARPAVQPPVVPFRSYLAGSGVVEASSGNIAVGTPVAGIVTALYVKPGDRVRAGDRLFKIDDRDLQAKLLPALAKEKEAKARLDQAEAQLQIAERVLDKRAISVEEINNRRFAARIAAASLGTAEAQVRQLGLEIDRRTVRALAPGEVLQVQARPGQFAATGGVTAPPMVLGNSGEYDLRVDVDEYDAWRVRRNATAVAFVRGNPQLRTPLRFKRIDPYLVAKTAFTGSGTERVDARVLQVIYGFDPGRLPNIYVGQLMDVFIEAPPPPLSGDAGAGVGRPKAASK